MCFRHSQREKRIQVNKYSMIKSFIIRYLCPFMFVFYRYIVIDSLLWSNATQDSRVQQRDKLATFFVKSRYTLHCLRQNCKLILFYFVYSNCAFSWTIFDIIKMLVLSNYVKYLLIYNYVYIYVFLCVWGDVHMYLCYPEDGLRFSAASACQSLSLGAGN